MIGAEKDIAVQERLLNDTLGNLLLNFWEIINTAGNSPDPAAIMRDDNNQKRIMYILKLNERIAYAVGYPYFLVLSKFHCLNRQAKLWII